MLGCCLFNLSFFLFIIPVVSILVFILDNCIEAVSGMRPPVALVVYEPEIKGRGGAQTYFRAQLVRSH